MEQLNIEKLFQTIARIAGERKQVKVTVTKIEKKENSKNIKQGA